jgi:hypothetical protein
LVLEACSCPCPERTVLLEVLDDPCLDGAGPFRVALFSPFSSEDREGGVAPIRLASTYFRMLTSFRSCRQTGIWRLRFRRHSPPYRSYASPSHRLAGKRPKQASSPPTEARIWNPAPMPTSVTRPSREPSGRATPQRDGNPYGKTTQRRSRGNRSRQIKSLGPCTHKSPNRGPKIRGDRHPQKTTPEEIAHHAFP